MTFQIDMFQLNC